MLLSTRTSKEARKVCNKLSEFLVTETKGECSWPKKSQSMPCIQRAEIVLDPEAAEEIS